MVACLRRLPRATRRRFQLSILVPLLPLYASGASAGVSGLDYPGTSDFLPQTPGVTAGAPGGLYNPAAWSLAPGELAAWLTPRGEDEGGRDDWGFSLAGPLGFAMDTRHVSVAPDRWARLRSYQFGLAGGDRRTQLGAAWRWHGGDADRLPVLPSTRAASRARDAWMPPLP